MKSLRPSSMLRMMTVLALASLMISVSPFLSGNSQNSQNINSHEMTVAQKINQPQQIVDVSASSNQNYTFTQHFLNSDMIITSKYALLGKSNWGVELKKVNFQKRELEPYPMMMDESYHSKIIYADLGNGDILAGFDEHLYVLDNETLSIKQELPPEIYEEAANSIYIYSDPITKQSRIFVGRYSIGSIYYELKKNSNGEYAETPMFASPYSSNYRLFLTGFNTAVSTNRDCDLTYWRNFDYVLARSRDPKYFMKERIPVAVSYDESFFVLRNVATAIYELYTLDEKYEIMLKSTFFINNSEHRKGIMAQDDKHLFVSLSDPKGIQNVAKIILEQSKVIFVGGNDKSQDNQIDFHLFSSNQNRVVTVASRNKQYLLQLRTVDALQLIDQLPLSFDFPILEYKLIGNFEWGSTFGLAVRTSPYFKDLEFDSKLYLFQNDEGKIKKLDAVGIDVSFAALKACYKYVVSYKVGFPKVKVFHYSNLSLAVEIDAISQYGVVSIIEKGTLIMSFHELNVVYNLQQSLESKGVFYSDPFITTQNYGFGMVFPRRQIAYFAINYHFFYDIPISKIIYNISSPPIVQTVNLEQPIQCSNMLYYSPQKKQQCNSVFYTQPLDYRYDVSKGWFGRYDECSKKTEKFNLTFEYANQFYVGLFISSDKKYVIIVMKDEQIWDRHLLQIRPIDSLQKIIYHQIFELETILHSLERFNADIVNDNMILFSTPVNIFVIFPNFADKDDPANKQIKQWPHSNLAKEE